MRKSMNLNVRIGGELGQHVAAQTGHNGSYDNSSEYVRDLIRKDKERIESEKFERLKAELQRAFAAGDDTYHDLTADDVITRNKSRSPVA